jgi:hypothetical protein
LEAVGSFGLLAAIAKELNCLRCIVKAFSHTFVRTRHLFSSRVVVVLFWQSSSF